MWSIMTNGFHSSVIELLGCMMKNSVIKVLVNGKLSSPFSASSMGIPQGDPSSPAWFNIYINSTTNICSKFTGVDLYGINIHLLLFVDDVISC